MTVQTNSPSYGTLDLLKDYGQIIDTLRAENNSLRADNARLAQRVSNLTLDIEQITRERDELRAMVEQRERERERERED